VINPVITTTISNETIKALIGKSRFFSFVMNNFSGTYFVFDDHTLKIYLKGNRSVVAYELPLVGPVLTPFAITADLSKFINAAKKTVGSGDLEITFNLSPTTLRLQGAIGDKITLSVTMADVVATTDLASFWQDKSPAILDQGVELTLSPALVAFVRKSLTFMAVNAKNNSIQLSPTKAVYADRTIVYEEQALSNFTATPTVEELYLHRTILGLFEFLEPGSTLVVEPLTRMVSWKHPVIQGFWGIFAIEPCSISVPSEDDLSGISPLPSHKVQVTVKVSKLKEAIEFFSGMFEASIWKPITFIWKDGTLKLTYLHPSTEVEKILDFEESFTTGPTITAADFTLISDSIRTSIDVMRDDDLLNIGFNDAKAGEPNGDGVVAELIREDVSVTKILYAKLQDGS